MDELLDQFTCDWNEFGDSNNDRESCKVKKQWRVFYLNKVGHNAYARVYQTIQSLQKKLSNSKANEKKNANLENDNDENSNSNINDNVELDSCYQELLKQRSHEVAIYSLIKQEIAYLTGKDPQSSLRKALKCMQKYFKMINESVTDENMETLYQQYKDDKYMTDIKYNLNAVRSSCVLKRMRDLKGEEDSR